MFKKTKQEIQDMINNSVSKAIKNLTKRCQTCGSGLVKWKEWSPDRPAYYFCSKKCYRKWHKESGEIYRASPLKRI